MQRRVRRYRAFRLHKSGARRGGRIRRSGRRRRGRDCRAGRRRVLRRRNDRCRRGGRLRTQAERRAGNRDNCDAYRQRRDYKLQYLLAHIYPLSVCPRRAPQENDWFFFYARDCTPRSFSNIISLPRRYIKKKKVKFIFLSKKHERCNGSR